MLTNLKEIRLEMISLGDFHFAEHHQRFFKTGPGQYGEGDRFHGLRVPAVRKMALRCQQLSLEQIESLLHSAFHEERFLALLLLVRNYSFGDASSQKTIYDLYLNNTKYINNWDLVDSSAHLIVGPWLENRDRAPLYQMAISPSLWEKRIAIMATFHFIRQRDFDDTLELAEILLNDTHDLIHKAVGWMLREIGNRDLACEEHFLKPRYNKMPRTMLRYAIEKFPEDLRLGYLKGTIS